MNQGIYQLVFSRVLNMVVPVSEAARSRATKAAAASVSTVNRQWYLFLY